MNVLKYILGLLVALTSAGSFAAEADFLAYGDMRGYLEPCGCDPATDLGGILRINSQLRRERLARPDVMVLNLGNNLAQKERDQLKNRFLLKGEVANSPAAYLVNELELLNLDLLGTAKLPYVLSNSKLGKKLPAESQRSFGKHLIFGYTWAKSQDGKTERVSTAMLARWRKIAEGNSSKQPVLLFSGPDDDLSQFAQSGIFSTIISSNKTPLGSEPGKEESQNESLLLRSVASRTFHMVPIGGQGLLRGGALTTNEAKPLSAYLESDRPVSKASGLFETPVKRVTWLKKDTEPGHALDEFYSEYSKAVAAAFKESGKERLAALKNSPFAGSAACASCHPTQYDVYKKSAHAHAMKTLIDKNKHEDPECVACHSVGSEVSGGFVSVADSPHLANVQCESCHGPRKEHTTNPAMKPAVSAKGEESCIGCHNRQHSPQFQFAKYWEKIKH